MSEFAYEIGERVEVAFISQRNELWWRDARVVRWRRVTGLDGGEFGIRILDTDHEYGVPASRIRRPGRPSLEQRLVALHGKYTRALGKHLDDDLTVTESIQRLVQKYDALVADTLKVVDKVAELTRERDALARSRDAHMTARRAVRFPDYVIDAEVQVRMPGWGWVDARICERVEHFEHDESVSLRVTARTFRGFEVTCHPGDADLIRLKPAPKPVVTVDGVVYEPRGGR